MSAESEQFQELRRLLALKRYEQPPPGYFNSFSRQVIARIEAGERDLQRSPVARIFGESSWFIRLWSSFSTKPILAGAFGVTICSVLIAGVAYSDRGENNPLPMLGTAGRDQSGFAQIAPPSVSSVNAGLPVSVMALPGTGGVVSVQERASLFQEVSGPKAQLIMDVVSPGRGN